MARAFNGAARVLFTGRYRAGREIVELLEDLIYTDDEGVFLIPKGSVSDGASLPWLLWWFCPPLGREARAAFLHDALLDQRPFSRKRIDRKFREALRCCGVPLWRRNVLWLGVRLFVLTHGDAGAPKAAQ